jgi:hypothetical protein
MTLSLILLIGAAILVAIAIAAVVFTLGQHRKQETQAQLRAREFIERQERAVWALATVVSVRGGTLGSEGGVSNWARCELSLQVTPPGGEPYLARTTWLVEAVQMSMLQPGQELSVKIDQQDPKIVYPNNNWAKYLPE